MFHFISPVCYILNMLPVLSLLHQNVFCQDCETWYLHNWAEWDTENNICQACSERWQCRLRWRVVLWVLTGKLCALCQQFLSEDLFHDAKGNTYERCKECCRSKLCAPCQTIKKCKHFLRSGQEHGSSCYWKTCKVCRLEVQLWTHQRWEAAHARGTYCISPFKQWSLTQIFILGMRWCTCYQKEVTVEECWAQGGALTVTCCQCLQQWQIQQNRQSQDDTGGRNSGRGWRDSTL